MSALRLCAVILAAVLAGGCFAPIGPATRENLGVPYPSLAAARLAVDSAQTALIIVVDTLVFTGNDPMPAPRDIARVRLVRNRPTCGRQNFACPSIIWVETRRPQWTPPSTSAP